MPVTVKFYLRILKEVQSYSYFPNKTNFNMFRVSKKYPVFNLRQIRSKDFYLHFMDASAEGVQWLQIFNYVNGHSNTLNPYVILTLTIQI